MYSLHHDVMQMSLWGFSYYEFQNLEFNIINFDILSFDRLDFNKKIVVPFFTAEGGFR
jgi:hypothetical protein